MDTTIDAKLVGKMIHSDCSQHHCRGSKRTPPTVPEAQQTPASLVVERWPPEFLHCGVWPPPRQSAESIGDGADKRTPVERKVKPPGQPVQVYPGGIPGTNKDATDSESSDSGVNGSRNEDDDDDNDMAITPAEPVTVTWDELSDAVDLVKMVPNKLSKDETPPKTARFKTPYSVLKLVARHGNSSAKKPPSSEADSLHPGKKPASPRQTLFDQEFEAECQARLEITDYLDTLADGPEFDEGFGCVWPLEDYRRQGWAKEMILAYPVECTEFVKKVREQLDRKQHRHEREGEVFWQAF
ncbi:hypothetical protein PV04_09592 [Phialophora macrospora]|uniref:Uncharacterized protein n=1 Tax=Phialophora macrospora TaxID=1851006 RepID=A0A0D2FXM7_9EURO|nr:hypothetical protein PV04_09592 [Phialophora macrospora]